MNLWIGFVLAVAAATAVVNAIAWQSAAMRGVERRRLLAASIRLWAAVWLAVAIGVGARWLIGGPIIDVATDPSRPAGLWLRPLARHQLAVVALALSAMAACFYWASRTLSAIAGSDRRGGHGES